MDNKLRKISYLVTVILLLTLGCYNENLRNDNVDNNNKENEMKEENLNPIDYSKKTILARACDPNAAKQFAKIISPLIGDAVYVPSTDDNDFIQKLKSQKWSVIFFAPGACRFSAANRAIPGGNLDTKGWTIEDYKNLVIKLQGEDVQIVETFDEKETINRLKIALSEAR